MDAEAHRIPIPRRRNPLAQRGEASRGNIIVAAVMHKIKVSAVSVHLVTLDKWTGLVWQELIDVSLGSSHRNHRWIQLTSRVPSFSYCNPRTATSSN